MAPVAVYAGNYGSFRQSLRGSSGGWAARRPSRKDASRVYLARKVTGSILGGIVRIEEFGADVRKAP